MGRWTALIALGTAQFLMVLDTSVMNVSISQLPARRLLAASRNRGGAGGGRRRAGRAR